jgi:hypothetical protein
MGRRLVSGSRWAADQRLVDTVSVTLVVLLDVLVFNRLLGLGE